jgi:hypothetical protein
MIADNKLVKYFIFPALLAIIVVLVRLYMASGEKSAAAAAFFLGIISLTVFYKKNPLHRIEDDGVYIKGIDKKIFFSEIIEIRRVSYSELGTGTRAGSPMPASAFGLFSFSTVGEVFINSNNDDRMVFIKTDDMQVIISPEEPDELVSMATHRRYGI